MAALGPFGISWPGRVQARLQPASLGVPGERLLAVLQRPASAAAIGRAYLAGHPEEKDRAWLAAELDRVLCGQGCDPAQAPPDRLRAALASRIRSDFAAARVVQVEGWILSETEARLCGLAALEMA